MEGIVSTEILTAVGFGAVVVLAFLFIIYAITKARRARRREIEESDQPKRKPAASEKVAREPTPQPEPLAPSKSTSSATLVTPDRATDSLKRPETKPEQDKIPVETPLAKPVTPSLLSPGLARTRAGWIARLGQVFAGKKEIDPSLVEEIERTLLTADIGVRTSQALMEEIKTSLGKREISSPDAIWDFLKTRSRQLLQIEVPPIDFNQHKPFVILTIGVNGSGKTTTIGKLAARIRKGGHSVLLAAGDTFRAAAAEQLEIWGNRVGAKVVRGKEGSDPSSVLFDAIKVATNEKIDVVIADTAGRLHTKTNLMEELQKVRRVMAKASAGSPHETWLIIDATNGQNAIAQAQIFTEAMAVTGVVLTKLDGTAKGGVILGIVDQLKLPVRYVGVGEKLDDLEPFDPDEFVDALFENATKTPTLH